MSYVTSFVQLFLAGALTAIFVIAIGAIAKSYWLLFLLGWGVL